MDKPGHIQWTERASSDIEAIVRYIARRDSTAAGRIGQGIYDRVQILWENPELGSYLDELREQGWRKLVFRQWKIIYTYRDQNIIVGRVWPAAMGRLTSPHRLNPMIESFFPQPSSWIVNPLLPALMLEKIFGAGRAGVFLTALV